MRFSIRDLFLVTLVVAVCVAWWVDRSRLARLYNQLLLEHVSEYHRKNPWLVDPFKYPPPASQAPAPNPQKK